MLRARADDTTGRSRDGLYEPVLAESEREAVADLLQYLENVRRALPIDTGGTDDYSAAKRISSLGNLYEL